MTKHIKTQWISVLDVDFLGLGSKEKLCPISRCINKCLDCVFWSRNDQDMFPQMKGGSTCWKKSKTNIYHLNNQTCFTLWTRCQQLKCGNFLTLDQMGWEWSVGSTPPSITILLLLIIIKCGPNFVVVILIVFILFYILFFVFGSS
jgi:hypothetical protein